jgi:hypothetical protein
MGPLFWAMARKARGGHCVRGWHSGFDPQYKPYISLCLVNYASSMAFIGLTRRYDGRQPVMLTIFGVIHEHMEVINKTG